MTEVVSLELALPTREAAQTVADVLVGLGMSIDIRPLRWPGTARPVLLLGQSGGVAPDALDEALLPLKDATDYEVIDRQEW